MGDIYPKFKVAAVQAAPVFLDREKTVEKACRLIREAGREGARVIGFPEAYIPGFPHWFDYRIARECMGLTKELFKNAVEIPSSATDALCEAARQARATVVMGVNERDPGTMGTLYNTQLFIGPEGSILGKHRKLVPTWTERLVHTSGDASTLKVYETDVGPVSGLICGENTVSFYRMALLLQGERIHVASWPAFPNRTNQSPIEIRTRYYAFEGKCFVISAAGVFSAEMVEMLCPSAEQKARVLGSGAFSSIIGPTGEYLAGPDTGGEKILYAEVDPEVTIFEKINQDVTGHYNRLDLFTLVVDDRVTSRAPVFRSDKETISEPAVSYRPEHGGGGPTSFPPDAEERSFKPVAFRGKAG
ncbi:MAG: carbon-nitrogen hydrolase family protein [Deltaproteobacteria bacterium]|nr:carbon-nitrogen hydrolase family protein [Deltaproteobacteria bacterium]